MVRPKPAHTDAIDPAPKKSTTRLRASKNTVAMTLKALQDAGVPIAKVLIEGSRIEIVCGGAAGALEVDDGLESWDDVPSRKTKRRFVPEPW